MERKFCEEELCEDPRRWLDLDKDMRRLDKTKNSLKILGVVLIVTELVAHSVSLDIKGLAAIPLLIIAATFFLILRKEDQNPNALWNSKRIERLCETEAGRELIKLYNHTRTFHDVSRMKVLWLEAHRQADLIAQDPPQIPIIIVILT